MLLSRSCLSRVQGQQFAPDAPMKGRPRAVLGLGSNLGDREAILDGAVAALGRAPGLEVVRASSVWETEPIGGPPQPNFYNMAVAIRCELAPLSLLGALWAIEQQFERIRTVRNGPRTLDLDVLWIEGGVVSHPRLEVPHPRLHERAFALAPLIELVADACDPRTGLLYGSLLAAAGTEGIRRIRRPLDAPAA